MSRLFARFMAEGIQVGVSVLSKAFTSAYQKAQAGGSHVSKAASTARMPIKQARQILNLEGKDDLTLERVNESFQKYYEANDPDKGGSFYVQAKIANAKDALIAEIKRNAAGGAAKPKADAGGEKLQ
jgi:import inner membrane translocase subunit TIM16